MTFPPSVRCDDIYRVATEKNVCRLFHSYGNTLRHLDAAFCSPAKMCTKVLNKIIQYD